MTAAVVLAASHHISMIVIGRIFQGVAVSPSGIAHVLTVTMHAADMPLHINTVLVTFLVSHIV